MKRILCVFLALMIYMISFGQRVERITVKGGEVADFIAKKEYKYPAFTRAKVYFKNGDIASAIFNYNYFNQSMKYIDDKGDTLAIANENDLKFIAIGIDSFFYDNGYYEWIASSGVARLAVKRKFNLAGREKVGLFGTTSPAHKVESHDAILENTTLNLDVNEELTFVKQVTYFISSINGHFLDANKKNIAKLFPKKDVEGFIKENKVNLNKEEDLIDLLVYLSKPK